MIRLPTNPAESFDGYRGLIKGCSQVIHFFEGIVARSKAAGDFYQFHDRSRVKEVHADEFISSLREPAKHGDGNGRRVAGNDGIFRAEFIKGLENVFLILTFSVAASIAR